jgi:hypothetical protein
MLFLRDGADDVEWLSGSGCGTEEEAIAAAKWIERRHVPGFATAYRVERHIVASVGEWQPIACRGEAEFEDEAAK